MNQGSLGAADGLAFVAAQAPAPHPALLGHAAASAPLKGGGGSGSLLPAPPTTFVPMPQPSSRAAGMQPTFGKLLVDQSPSLQLLPGSGTYSIHAYGRPLTELDFISPGALVQGGGWGAWQPEERHSWWLLTGRQPP